MEDKNNVLKGFKEAISREKMEAYLSQKDKHKRNRIKVAAQPTVTYELVTKDKLDRIGCEIANQKKLKCYYIRVSGSGVTPITKEKYSVEKNIAPSSWKYIVGTIQEVRIELNKLGLSTLKLG